MRNKIVAIVVIGMIVVAAAVYSMTNDSAPQAPAQNNDSQTNTQPSPAVLPPPAPAVKEFSLVFAHKKLVQGPETIQVTEGDDVKITVVSDEPEEWHLHGYDNSIVLKAGVPAVMEFKADVSGRFAAELEVSKLDVNVLEVLPK